VDKEKQLAQAPEKKSMSGLPRKGYFFCGQVWFSHPEFSALTFWVGPPRYFWVKPKVSVKKVLNKMPCNQHKTPSI